MSKLYVAKVNLKSNISDVYEGDNLQLMKQRIHSAMPDVSEYVHEVSKLVNGETIKEEYTYTVFITMRTTTELYGTIVRQGKIHYKTLNKKSADEENRYAFHSPEVAEEIKFLYDVFAERIAFNIKSRFKYKQFIEGMTGIINKCMAQNNYDYFFELSLCTTGINVSKLKESLKEISHITELEFDFQLPNPDEELDDIRKNPEAYIESLEAGNIDDFSNIFRSKRGINIDSKPISDSLEMANKIHSSIPDDVAFSNGYVKVNAKNIEGINYSSEEDGIFTRDINDLEDFVVFCRQTILMVRKRR